MRPGWRRLVQRFLRPTVLASRVTDHLAHESCDLAVAKQLLQMQPGRPHGSQTRERHSDEEIPVLRQSLSWIIEGDAQAATEHESC